MKHASPSLERLIAQIQELMPIMREQHHVSTLEVFGSIVRGEQTEHSDLDLLVTFDRPPSLFRFAGLENYLSDTLGVKVDLVMKDSLKPVIGKHILAEVQSI